MLNVSTRRAASALVLATAVFGVAACGSSAADKPAEQGAAQGGSDKKDTIVFAAVPSEASQSLKDQYGNVIKLIEKETGKKVQYQDATDYSAVIEGQRAGKIDIAGYGPFSYKIAKDSGVQIEPIGAGVKKKGETPGYNSTLWTKPDSGIKSINDIKGKKVCFVDPASTSGNLFPTAGVKKAGLDPDKDITRIFAGAHDASMLSTLNGQCDAGFAQDSQIASMVKKNQIKDGELVKVWDSPLIPGSPIAMNTKTLDADTQAKIKAAFKSKANVDALVTDGICTDAAACKMAGDATWGYVAVEDSFYQPVREVCDQTQAEACKVK